MEEIYPWKKQIPESYEKRQKTAFFPNVEGLSAKRTLYAHHSA